MISFIIPTLNEEKVIEKTLKNLSEYSGDKEIIISDGKSADSTVNIAHKYTDKIFIHNKDTRQTIAEARNLGAEKAMGEQLVFLDADVYIPTPNAFFARVSSILAQDNTILAIIPSIRVFPEMETFGDKIVFSAMDYVHAFLNNISGIGGAPGEFQIVRRDAFQSILGFNPKLSVAEDHEFLRRLAKKGKIRFEKKLRVYHTGRRAHKIGWPKLLWSWSINGLHSIFFKKSFNKEWEEIR